MKNILNAMAEKENKYPIIYIRFAIQCYLYDLECIV